MKSVWWPVGSLALALVCLLGAGVLGSLGLAVVSGLWATVSIFWAILAAFFAYARGL